MRRHYNVKSEDYIDWLKSFGCVFYAPLDESNGLVELINNVNPTVQSEGQVTWDSTYNMYRFKETSASSYPNGRALTYSIPDMGFSDGGPISLLVEAKTVSSSGTYNAFFAMPDFYNIRTGQTNCAYICSARYSGVTASNLNKYAHTVPLMDGVNSVILKWYCNGTLYTSSNWTSKVVVGSNTVSICQSNNVTGSFEMYAKKAMIFNRVLTLDEIKQIQDIQ